jgi:hypothetical protein
MKNKILTGILFIAIIFPFLSFDMPNAWFKAGDKVNSYEMGIDKMAGQNGENAATIKSIADTIAGFGLLMQECLPDKYLGKRVRFRAYVKTKDVKQWAGILFRVDGKNQNEMLSFDNLKDGKTDRSIKGTTDWKQYEIVLNVPYSATNLAFGALLMGTGQIWFNKITFEVVDNSVHTTGKGEEVILPNKEPTNLNFDN